MARSWWLLSVASMLVFPVALSAQARAAGSDKPFYQGKTLTVVVGTGPGGTGDMRAKASSQHLQKYLPGNPTIVYRYIPNVIQASNHMATVAARDGLTILFIGPTLYSNGILGATGVRYKVEDFVSLGSPFSGGPYTLIVRPQLGLDTVEKLRAYSGLRFAQRSVGHSMYILDRMMAFILDLKEPKWVLGYGNEEVSLAVERGEADAQSNGVYTLMKDKAHWLKEGYTVPLVMTDANRRGPAGIPGFPQDRPFVERYADTKLKRDVLQLHNAMRPSGMLFLAPKGIPEPALRDLKESLNKVWKDPEFGKDYERLTKEPVDPTTGDEIERVLQEIPRDPKVMEIYKQIIGGGPLPASK